MTTTMLTDFKEITKNVFLQVPVRAYSRHSRHKSVFGVILLPSKKGILLLHKQMSFLTISKENVFSKLRALDLVQ